MGCGSSAADAKYAETPQDTQTSSSSKAPAKYASSRDAPPMATRSSVSAVVRKDLRLIQFYSLEKHGLAFARSQQTESLMRITDKTTKQTRACRTVRSRRVDGYSMSKEIELHDHLDHPNIAKLHEVFEDELNTYLVYPWCEGGKLLDCMHQSGELSECQAAHLAQQLLQGISHMHAMLICHRNLDLEHLYIFDKAPLEKCTLKIYDLSYACAFKQGVGMRADITEWGSIHYMAPEVFTEPRHYFSNIDSWAVGICTFVLLCGELPFEGKDAQEVSQAITAAADAAYQKGFESAAAKEDYKGDGSVFLQLGDVSDQAKEFVHSLLNADMGLRASARDALNLKWMKDPQKESKKLLTKSVLKGMKAYAGRSLLQKKALQVIACCLSEDEIKGIAKMFAKLDANGDGVVTLSELGAGIKKARKKKGPKNTKSDTESQMEELYKMMEAMDSDGSSSISYTEFVAACLQEKHFEQEAVCWNAFKKLFILHEAFRYFDHDNSGSISRQELLRCLKNEDFGDMLPSEIASLLLKSGDKDGNSTIEFHEFMAIVQPKKDWSHLDANGKAPKITPKSMGTCSVCKEQRKVQDFGNGIPLCAACWIQQQDEDEDDD